MNVKSLSVEQAETLKRCLTARYREISRLSAEHPAEKAWDELLALVRLTDALGLDYEELYHRDLDPASNDLEKQKVRKL